MSAQGNTEHNTTDRERLIAQLKPLIIDRLKNAFPQNPEVADNIEAIFGLLASQPPFIPDDETRKLGIDFLYEATRDVKSCKLLYSKKLYPHAVYHLQQAVEKSIKGYVLSEGYFKTTEIKEITTHYSPLVMIKAVLEKTGIKNLAEKLSDKSLLTKIKDAEAAIDNEEERIKIARINQDEIRELISHKEEYQKMTSMIEQGFAKDFIDIGSGSSPISFLKAVSSMMTIMILAIITFPHEAYTRYPNGKMTPNNYDKQLGIVRETPRIARLLESEIKSLEEFYKQ